MVVQFCDHSYANKHKIRFTFNSHVKLNMFLENKNIFKRNESHI